MDKNLSFFNYNDLKFLRIDNHFINLNHSIAAWPSVGSVERRFSIVLSAAVTVLPSAKFSRFVFVIQRYRSFINIFKRGRPSIERWRTPDKSSWNWSTMSIVNFYILFPSFYLWVKKSNSIYRKPVSIHFSYEKIMRYGVKSFW